jgi:hypothetical protein
MPSRRERQSPDPKDRGNQRGRGRQAQNPGEMVLTGETVHPSTERVEPVRGCLNNPSRLVWTTLTSLTASLAALRSRKETKEKLI